MPPVELLTVSLSVVSLITSGSVAYFAYRLSARQLRLNMRNEIGKLILEINREVIRDPTLIYHLDSRRPPGTPKPDHLQQVKLEAFCHILLNAAELVFTLHHSRSLTEREKHEWEVWVKVFENRLRDSTLLRELIERPDVVAAHSLAFLTLVRELSSRAKPPAQ